MAFEQFTSEHPYLTFFLGVAAIHGIVTIVRGHEPPVVIPPDLFAPHPAAHPMAPMHPAYPRATSPYGAPPHMVGAPGQDYSFTRRPGYNDKNY